MFFAAECFALVNCVALASVCDRGRQKRYSELNTFGAETPPTSPLPGNLVLVAPLVDGRAGCRRGRGLRHGPESSLAILGRELAGARLVLVVCRYPGSGSVGRDWSHLVVLFTDALHATADSLRADFAGAAVLEISDARSRAILSNLPRGKTSSVFISYGGPDSAMAMRINDALREKGVKTWFFPRDATPGEKRHRTMSEGVNEHDRVLLPPGGPMRSSAAKMHLPGGPIRSSAAKTRLPGAPTRSAAAKTHLPRVPMRSSAARTRLPGAPTRSSAAKMRLPGAPMRSSAAKTHLPAVPMRSPAMKMHRPARPARSSGPKLRLFGPEDADLDRAATPRASALQASVRLARPLRSLHHRRPACPRLPTIPTHPPPRATRPPRPGARSRPSRTRRPRRRA